MLDKGAIEQVETSNKEVVSGFFDGPKKMPGKRRPIVSLKQTNRYIRKIGFRMTTPKDIKHWIRPGYYFVSIGLTDAYFMVPLHKSARPFTWFRWKALTYQFLCIMFGLGLSARIFNKMVNLPVKFLRL